MLIIDGQIHLWEKGAPSPPHRQEPYSAEQAIAALDQAVVDRTAPNGPGQDCGNYGTETDEWDRQPAPTLARLVIQI